MADQPGAGRLDPETLAAYIDGLLPPEERAKVEVEIVTDPESYEWVVNAVNAVDDASIPMAEETPIPVPAPAPRPVLPFYRRRGVQAALAGVAAAAAALVLVVRTQPVWWQSVWGPSVDPRFAQLVEAVGEERYIEARLTGGFKYGPLRDVRRGTTEGAHDNPALLGLAVDLERAGPSDVDLSRPHVLGVVLLLLGGQTGDAVVALETAAKSGDASALADLGAAYLERWRVTGNSQDLAHAIQKTEQSLAIEPRQPEALFNRALALEYSGGIPAAVAAWEHYLDVDRSGAWSDDGQRHLEALKRHPL